MREEDGFDIYNFDHIQALMAECNQYVKLCNMLYQELGEEEGEITGEEDRAIRQFVATLVAKFDIYDIAS